MASEDKGPLLNDDEEYDITRSMTPEVGEAECDKNKNKNGGLGTPYCKQGFNGSCTLHYSLDTQRNLVRCASYALVPTSFQAKL